jgi:hypothetical protein
LDAFRTARAVPLAPVRQADLNFSADRGRPCVDARATEEKCRAMHALLSFLAWAVLVGLSCWLFGGVALNL